jgi:hypothetical protein
MTPQWVTQIGTWEQRFNRVDQSIDHFGLERAHDEGTSTVSLAVASHPTSKSGQPSDRWMVTYSRGP